MGRVAAQRGRRDAQALALRRACSALDALAVGGQGDGDAAVRARWEVAVELRAAALAFGSLRALAARLGLAQGQLRQWLRQTEVPSSPAVGRTSLERPSVPQQTDADAPVPVPGEG